MTLRVGFVKTYPTLGDLAGNTQRLLGVLGDLAARQPDVVVTPEGFLDGYVAMDEHVTRETIRAYAVDPETSPYVRAVRDWAAQHQAWVVLGCVRPEAGGGANTALLINRQGEVAGHYDKVHCRDHDQKYVAGNRLPAFPSDFGLFGVMICADRRWPETVRTLVLQGARVIFNPTYGTHNEMNVQLMRTRSFESEVYIAFAHPGQSLVTDPRGAIVLDQTSPGKTWAVAEINLEQVDQRRASEKSFLRTRRPDAYRLE